MHGLWHTRDYVERCSSLEFYLQHLADAGLRCPKLLYTYRNPRLGYLTFVCRR
jgi:hypothetical protein